MIRLDDIQPESTSSFLKCSFLCASKVKDDVKFDLNKLAAGEMFCVNCPLDPERGLSSSWFHREKDGLLQPITVSTCIHI